jgi:hypothetical protein
MKMPRAVLLVLFGTLSLSAREAAAGRGATTVTRGDGCVREGNGSECKPIASGGHVPQQATFVAGPQGALLTVEDTGTMDLAGGSEIRLLAPTTLRLSAREEPRASVFQLKGKATAESVRAASGPSSSALLFRGLHGLSAIVRAGRGVVRSSDDGITVAALEGTLLIASGNDWMDVKAGTVRGLRKTDTRATTRPLLPAPLVSAERTLSTDPASPPKVSWISVASAIAYEVRLSAAGRPDVVRRVEKQVREASPETTEPGAYELRVRAVDEDSLESDWSAAIPVNVVALGLPPGSVAIPGGVELPMKSKVKLLGTTGLEAAYNDETSFSAAPNEVGLLTDSPRVLRLRRPSGKEEVRIRLAPRTSRAEVELAPKNATWPRDPVTIRIRLVDGSGRPLPSSVEAVPNVTLGIEKVDVPFSREGNVLTATLPPRAVAQPTVVRVEVSDQHGITLGRGFLEIAKDAKK